jgi:hypothetical protein
MEIHVAYDAKVQSNAVYNNALSNAKFAEAEFNTKNPELEAQINALSAKLPETDEVSFGNTASEGKKTEGSKEPPKETASSKDGSTQVSSKAQSQADEIAAIRAQVAALRAQQETLKTNMSNTADAFDVADADLEQKENDLKSAYSENKAEVSQMKKDFDASLGKFNNFKSHKTLAQNMSDGIAGALWNSRNTESSVQKDVDSMSSKVNSFVSIGDSAKIRESYTNQKSEMHSDISNIDSRIETYMEKCEKGAGRVKTGVSVAAGVATAAVTGGNAIAGAAVGASVNAMFNANEAYKDDNHLSAKDVGKVAVNFGTDFAIGAVSGTVVKHVANTGVVSNITSKAGATVGKLGAGVKNAVGTFAKNTGEGVFEATASTVRDAGVSLATTGRASASVGSTVVGTTLGKASGVAGEAAGNSAARFAGSVVRNIGRHVR